jgi:hypothetical protein
MALAEHRYVFVGGLQRSGTTMLYRYLDEHPEVSALSGTARDTNEGQHNQTVYPGDEWYGKGGRFAFRPEARFTEASPLVTPENAEKLYEEWSRFWDTSKPYLLEKSPPNLIRMRFLQALFPDAYFVALLRHPIPVTLATQPWGGDRTHRLLEHWLRAHELFVEDLPRLERVHVVRYEDLVADPDAVLGRTFSFLGLEDVNAGREKAEGVNRDNFEADRTLRTGVNDKYFAAWRARKRGLVPRAYYAAIERRHERGARQYGYSLRRPETLFEPTLDLPGLPVSVREPASVTA